MYKINQEYFKDGKFRNLHEFYLENEKILNDYEKTRPDKNYYDQLAELQRQYWFEYMVRLRNIV